MEIEIHFKKVYKKIHVNTRNYFFLRQNNHSNYANLHDI